MFAFKSHYWYYDRWLSSSTEFKITSARRQVKQFWVFVGLAFAVLIVGWLLGLRFSFIFGGLYIGGTLWVFMTTAVYYFSIFRGMGVTESWQKFAEEEGLITEPSKFSNPAAVSGLYRGRELRLTISGKKVNVTLSLDNPASVQLLLKVGGVQNTIAKYLETFTTVI